MDINGWESIIKGLLREKLCLHFLTDEPVFCKIQHQGEETDCPRSFSGTTAYAWLYFGTKINQACQSSLNTFFEESSFFVTEFLEYP
mgnify:CR=1 FL=1